MTRRFALLAPIALLASTRAQIRAGVIATITTKNDTRVNFPGDAGRQLPLVSPRTPADHEPIADPPSYGRAGGVNGAGRRDPRELHEIASQFLSAYRHEQGSLRERIIRVLLGSSARVGSGSRA